MSEQRIVTREALAAALDSIQGEHHFYCSSQSKKKPCDCWHLGFVKRANAIFDALPVPEPAPSLVEALAVALIECHWPPPTEPRMFIEAVRKLLAHPALAPFATPAEGGET